MFKNITFTAVKQVADIKNIQPIPSKKYIPKWFKELEHHPGKLSVKGCVPVLDSMLTGYLLRLSEDVKISFNKYNNETKINETEFNSASSLNPCPDKKINLNYGNPEIHPIEQVGGEGCPYPSKNKNYPIMKILNPWKIITPPGYSCLFIPPMHRTIEHWNILPAIVDTDVFNLDINFPIVINSDKYPMFDVIFPQGLPYVQVIPFKRDNWEMSVKIRDDDETKNNWVDYFTTFINKYKNNYWRRKICK